MFALMVVTCAIASASSVEYAIGFTACNILTEPRLIFDTLEECTKSLEEAASVPNVDRDMKHFVFCATSAEVQRDWRMK